MYYLIMQYFIILYPSLSWLWCRQDGIRIFQLHPGKCPTCPMSSADALRVRSVPKSPSSMESSLQSRYRKKITTQIKPSRSAAFGCPFFVNKSINPWTILCLSAGKHVQKKPNPVLQLISGTRSTVGWFVLASRLSH